MSQVATFQQQFGQSTGPDYDLVSCTGFLQTDALVRITPFVTVIIVLALVGRTRLPSAAGEHYESGDE